MRPELLTVQLVYERDVVVARQRAHEIAALLGFDLQDQTRIATAVSEIARNAFRYGQEGQVEFGIDGITRPQVLRIAVHDRGPGIPDLPAVLEGRYRSRTGMGAGITGARRLMDHFEIESSPERGTRVALKKVLPRDRPLLDDAGFDRLVAELTRRQPRDPIDEVQLQNRDLLRALDENQRRQEELSELNHELEDTNRGVVALYAELDEKADHLRRADEIKTRFISNMSHEFRTPVNSIQALAALLRTGADGPLSAEQQRQVQFIERAANDLSELVNDLLDLAKVEAGKIEVRPVEFELERMFGALRGMLRPLLMNESVNLVFDDPEGLPSLYTDEGKVSQILRNFISNALKFTEQGEVRVSARLTDGGRRVALTVSDTGIGIDPADHERIFQEFAQIENPIQRRVRGTGLGLPLCRRLAELLGGTVSVASDPGRGSRFTAELPILYEPLAPLARQVTIDPDRIPVLAVEDSLEILLLYEKYVSGSHYQIVSARTVRQAREALVHVRPRAILLDIVLRGEDAWGFLTQLKRSEETRAIPIAVISTIEDQQKGLALGADAYCVKPIERHDLLKLLTRLIAPHTMRRILIVDDDDVARYILRQHLQAPNRVIEEAPDGATAIERAIEFPPDVICLDLSMPGMTGHEVLRRLRNDPRTRGIPVVVVSSVRLEAEERRALLSEVHGILSKDDLSEERIRNAIEAALRRPEHVQ